MLDRRLRIMALAVSALWLLTGPSVAQEPTALEQLRAGMKGMQGQIAASSHKFKKGMRGVSGKAETPAMQCCASHLEILKRKSGDVAQALDNLHVYYTESRNSVALEELQYINAVMRRLSHGAQAFARAEHPTMANQALLGLIRPFNDFKAAVQRLEDCCPVVTPEPAKEDEKKAGKKKKKDKDA